MLKMFLKPKMFVGGSGADPNVFDSGSSVSNGSNGSKGSTGFNGSRYFGSLLGPVNLCSAEFSSNYKRVLIKRVEYILNIPWLFYFFSIFFLFHFCIF